MDGHVFFNEENVWVTGASFINGATSYPIASIHGVAVIQNTQIPLLCIFGAIISAAVFAWYPVTAIVLLAASVGFGLRQRGIHFLRLTVDGESVPALKSRNQSYLQKVQGAIGKAMIFRDSPATLPSKLQDV
jgi:hypothetical protein